MYPYPYGAYYPQAPYSTVPHYFAPPLQPPLQPPPPQPPLQHFCNVTPTTAPTPKQQPNATEHNCHLYDIVLQLNRMRKTMMIEKQHAPTYYRQIFEHQQTTIDRVMDNLESQCGHKHRVWIRSSGLRRGIATDRNVQQDELNRQRNGFRAQRRITAIRHQQNNRRMKVHRQDRKPHHSDSDNNDNNKNERETKTNDRNNKKKRITELKDKSRQTQEQAFILNGLKRITFNQTP